MAHQQHQQMDREGLLRALEERSKELEGLRRQLAHEETEKHELLAQINALIGEMAHLRQSEEEKQAADAGGGGKADEEKKEALAAAAEEMAAMRDELDQLKADFGRKEAELQRTREELSREREEMQRRERMAELERQRTDEELRERDELLRELTETGDELGRALNEANNDLQKMKGTSKFSIAYSDIEFEENKENSEFTSRKRNRQQHMEIGQFENEEDWVKWMHIEDTWTKNRIQDSTGTIYRKEYFKCRHSRREAKCPASLIVEIHKQTGEIIVKQNQNHTEHGLSEFTTPVKHFIREKLEQSMKPAQIRDALLRKNDSTPLMSQVKNFVAYEKRRSGINEPISVEELRIHCTQHSIEPEDPNSPFIIAYRVESATQVIIIWSTLHLLATQMKWVNICIDGTYKILSLNWPILRAGFTDANGRFYNTAICLASSEDAASYTAFFEAIKGAQQAYNPSILMADSALAITSAQKKVWPGTNRYTCFFHVMKSLKEKFKRRPLADYAEEVFMDVNALSRAGSFPEFYKAARVLNSHWALRFANLCSVKEALTSFVEFYIKDYNNNGWFAGEGPRTNNALESANRQFKERETFRRRLPVREFLEIAPSHMRISSLSPEHQNPATRPSICNVTLKAAYEFYKLNRIWIQIQDDEETVLIPSKTGLAEFGTKEAAPRMVELYNQIKSEDEDEYGFQSWSHYMEIRSKFHYVRRSTIWQDYFYCSCWQGTKRKPCRHNVFVMQKKGLIGYPAAITAELLQASRSRGRPKKVHSGTALVRDQNI